MKPHRFLALTCSAFTLFLFLFADKAPGGSSPADECGEGIAYNKYEMNEDGSIGPFEGTTPPGQIVFVESVGENQYFYNNTNNKWLIVRRIVKAGKNSDVLENPPQSGTVTAEKQISHIIFCLCAYTFTPIPTSTLVNTETKTATPTATPTPTQTQPGTCSLVVQKFYRGKYAEFNF